MSRLRPFLARFAWLVCCTVVLAALLPLLSHAMAPRAPALAEICSATGARFVLVTDMDGAVDIGRDDAPTVSSSMDCPYCSLHHGAPSLPPAPLTWATADTLRFEMPRLFLQAPRPLFAWAPALARGPPLLA